MTDSPSAPHQPSSNLDTRVPHSARIWNYWLGGKDNFAADREAGEQIVRLVPDLVTSARADREFLGRTVRYLAGSKACHNFPEVVASAGTGGHNFREVVTILTRVTMPGWAGRRHEYGWRSRCGSCCRCGTGTAT